MTATPTGLPSDTYATPSVDCDATIDAVAASVRDVETNLLARFVDVELASQGVSRVSCTLADAPTEWRQLVPMASTWRYLDSGVDPGPSWMDPGFDDGAWKVGTSMFGWGDDAATFLGNHSDDEAPTVTWYRTTFSVTGAASIGELGIQIARDDGAAVYLNGVEVLRDNLPEGALTGSTQALEVVSGGDEEQLLRAPIDSGPLVEGTNTLAVSLHQSGNSEDATMEVRLIGRFPMPMVDEVITAAAKSLGSETTVHLAGLLPDATYSCEASSTCGGATVPFDVTTVALGPEFPRIARHPTSDAPSWGTWTLLNHQRPCAGDYQSRFLILDPDGQIRWIYEPPGMTGGSTIDLESAWLGNGRILWGGGDVPEGAPQIIRLDHVVDHVTAWPGADGDYHHDVAWVDGDIVGLLKVDNTDGSSVWDGISIVKHNPDSQTLTWRWDSQDAFDRGEMPDLDGDSDHLDDPWHANGMEWVDDAWGTGVYLSLLYREEVIRVDVDTGSVSWVLGRGGDFTLVDAAGTPLSEDLWWTGIHAVNESDGIVSVYDNGPNPSHVIGVRLDKDAMTAELVWHWTEFGWYEPIWGDADLLPNGNMFVNMAHTECNGGNAFHPGSLVDVDKDTLLPVWRLDMLDYDDSSYRSERIEACEMFGNSRWCP